MAMLASAASYLVEDDHLSIRRAANQHDRLQAQYLAESGLQWAMLVLQKDGENNEIDHLNEPWTTLDQPLSIENGTLSIEVIDVQGRFNINNLRNDPNGLWSAALSRLLESADLAPELASTLKDWIDDDSTPTGIEGAEDDHYLLNDPPYRTANDFIRDISELKLIKGINDSTFEKLNTLVTALPTSEARININTCPEALFAIFGREVLAEGVGAALAAGRGEDGYQTMEDFVTQTELASHGEVASALGRISSDFFVVNITSTYGRITLSNRYLLKREIDEGVYIDLISTASVS